MVRQYPDLYDPIYKTQNNDIEDIKKRSWLKISKLMNEDLSRKKIFILKLDFKLKFVKNVGFKFVIVIEKN